MEIMFVKDFLTYEFLQKKEAEKERLKKKKGKGISCLYS